MKIRIEFTTTEKVAIMNGCEAYDDESAKSKGNFGTAEYNAKENYLDFEFKESFIVAIANLIGTFSNMIKGMIKTFKIFESSWLKDIETEYPDRKESKADEPKEDSSGKEEL